MGKAREGVLIKAVDGVMLVLTLVIATGGVFALLAPHVNPNSAWMFAYAGLAAPILFLSNLFLLLYWILRWKLFFVFPAIILFFGIPKVKLFFHFSGKQEMMEKAKDELRILTYNVEGFLDYDSKNKQTVSTALQIIDFIKETDPDIICFQEYQSTPNIPESKLNEWLSDWPYKQVYNTFNKNKNVWGTAVYSKFPILSHGEIEFENSRNGSLWVELLVGKNDTLRVINNHLETTYVDKSNVAFLQLENFASEPDKSGKIKQIAGRLRKGFCKRAHQADTIQNIIASSQLPTLVCGDFNDTPMSYSYRTIRDGYNDAFVKKGTGYGYTYKHLYRLMRIDYVFLSPHFETVSYETPDVPWSDHLPVVVTFKRQKTDENTSN